MEKFNVSAVLTEEEAAVIANMRRKRAEAEKAERAERAIRRKVVPVSRDEMPPELVHILDALFGENPNVKVCCGHDVPTPTPEPAKVALDDSAELEAEDAEHQAELEAKEQTELTGYQEADERQKLFEEYEVALDNLLANLYENDFIVNVNYDSEGLHLSIEDVM